MNNAISNYIISNGKYARDFLKEISEKQSEARTRNMVLNHSFSVNSLIELLVSTLNQLEQKENYIIKLEKELLSLKLGDFKDLLNKTLDEVKEDLISSISETIEYKKR